MRNIFIVNATQVVTSESHPEGLYSVVSGYPKTYDSRNYAAPDANPNGDSDAASEGCEIRVLQPPERVLRRFRHQSHGDRDA